jgi:hypothetical protein
MADTITVVVRRSSGTASGGGAGSHFPTRDARPSGAAPAPLFLAGDPRLTKDARLVPVAGYGDYHARARTDETQRHACIR